MQPYVVLRRCGKITPPSKTRYNYARNFKLGMYEHTHIQFQKIYLLVPKVLLILLMSAFFGKIKTFTQSSSVRAVLEIFKVTINENINFTDYASGIWLPNCSKLAKNQKYCNEVTIFWHGVIVNFFSKFIYWSEFLVNIITCSGVMTIFFYKRLTRNPEIRSTPVWVLPNIGRLGRLRDSKFRSKLSHHCVQDKIIKC